MSKLKITNNAASRLSANISAADTSISLLPGDGAKFPVLGVDEWFPATFVKVDGTLEIVRVIARATDVFTVVRGQEATAALSFNAGDRVEHRFTAAAYTEENARVEAIAQEALDTVSTSVDDLIENLSSGAGSTMIGNGAETVAASFNSLQLADYAALRSYVGPRNLVFLSGYVATTNPTGVAGVFTRSRNDTTSLDNGATIIVSADGTRWKRQFKGSVDIRWWLARFDGVTDDTAAVQACCNYAVPLQLEIVLPPGKAKISAPIALNVANNGLNMRGQGYQKTRFEYSALSLGSSLFELTGSSGSLQGALVQGIGFEGNSGTNAFAIIGGNGQVIDRCQFHTNAFACVMNNTAEGQFSEFNILRNCDFTIECKSAIWYLVSGDEDASFHGSGIEGGVINNSGSNPVLVLSPRAYPYNAPFSPTIFIHANVTVISYSAPSGGYRPYFFGTLKLEVQGGRALLCDAPVANAIPYAGEVLSQSGNVEFGSLFICDAVFNTASGSRQTVGGRVSRVYALSTGATTLPVIPYNIMEGCVFISVRVVGPNYEYRTLHCSWGAGVGGSMQLIATPGQFNTAGYGPPAITINGSNQIVITNASYPATGLNVLLDIVQIGQSPFTDFVQ